MLYRSLGTTGLRVSVIGIGTWQFGGEWGHDFSQGEVDAILDKGVELGVNLIDTAECYGDHTAERFLGDYLSRRERSRWIVATKFGHHFRRFMDRLNDFSPADVRKQLDTSLRALRVETIDLYQFHSGSDSDFQNDELWNMLAVEKRAGKIQHLGISILGKGSTEQAQRARAVGAEVLQIIYNRLDRRPEQMYFPHAEREQLGVLARVPLASGLLTGKYSTDSQFAANDVRTTFDRERWRRDLTEVEDIRQSELPPNTPMAQWALAWVLRNRIVSAAIPGCKSPAQVVSNAGVVDLLQA